MTRARVWFETIYYVQAILRFYLPLQCAEVFCRAAVTELCARCLWCGDVTMVACILGRFLDSLSA